MQKVISINLNGNAYQLDESGYDPLREYLAVAECPVYSGNERLSSGSSPLWLSPAPGILAGL
jgi:hypothetical protein